MYNSRGSGNNKTNYKWSAVIVKGMEENEEFNASVKDIIKLIISSLSINNSVPLE